MWRDGKCWRCDALEKVEQFRAGKPDPDFAPYFYCIDGLNLHPDIAADLTIEVFKELCPSARQDPADNDKMIIPGGSGARYSFGYEGKLSYVSLDVRLSGTTRTGFMAFDKSDPFFVWNQLGFGNFRIEAPYVGRLHEIGAKTFSGYKKRTLIEGTVGRDGKVIEMSYLTKG